MSSTTTILKCPQCINYSFRNEQQLRTHVLVKHHGNSSAPNSTSKKEVICTSKNADISKTVSYPSKKNDRLDEEDEAVVSSTTDVPSNQTDTGTVCGSVTLLEREVTVASSSLQRHTGAYTKSPRRSRLEKGGEKSPTNNPLNTEDPNQIDDNDPIKRKYGLPTLREVGNLKQYYRYVPVKAALKYKTIKDKSSGMFKCHVCNFTSKIWRNASRHHISVHMKARPYHCLQCSGKFKLFCHINSHVKSVHKDVVESHAEDDSTGGCQLANQKSRHGRRTRLGTDKTKTTRLRRPSASGLALVTGDYKYIPLSSSSSQHVPSALKRFKCVFNTKLKYRHCYKSNLSSHQGKLTPRTPYQCCHCSHKACTSWEIKNHIMTKHKIRKPKMVSDESEEEEGDTVAMVSEGREEEDGVAQNLDDTRTLKSSRSNLQAASLTYIEEGRKRKRVDSHLHVQQESKTSFVDVDMASTDSDGFSGLERRVRGGSRKRRKTNHQLQQGSKVKVADLEVVSIDSDSVSCNNDCESISEGRMEDRSADNAATESSLPEVPYGARSHRRPQWFGSVIAVPDSDTDGYLSAQSTASDTSVIQQTSGRLPYARRFERVGFSIVPTDSEEAIEVDLRKSRAHQCPQCGEVFDTVEATLDHFRVHSGHQPYVCDFCGFRTGFESEVKGHLKRQSVDRLKLRQLYTLRNDDGRGNSLTEAKCEMPNGSYKCNQCPRRFTFITNLRQHLRIHTKDKPYHCNLCGYKASQQPSVKNHIKNNHRKCIIICPQRSHDVENFSMNDVDDDTQLNKRRKRKRKRNQDSFQRPENIVESRSEERNVSEYAAMDASSSQMPVLSNANHLPENWFSHQIGQVEKTSTPKIKRESKKHQGRFPCLFCDKLFDDLEDCVTHVRLHTGETPYRCNLCGYSTCYEKKMVMHGKQVHEGGDDDVRGSLEDLEKDTVISCLDQKDLKPEEEEARSTLDQNQDENGLTKSSISTVDQNQDHVDENGLMVPSYCIDGPQEPEDIDSRSTVDDNGLPMPSYCVDGQQEAEDNDSRSTVDENQLCENGLMVPSYCSNGPQEPGDNESMSTVDQNLDENGLMMPTNCSDGQHRAEDNHSRSTLDQNPGREQEEEDNEATEDDDDDDQNIDENSMKMVYVKLQKVKVTDELVSASDQNPDENDMKIASSNKGKEQKAKKTDTDEYVTASDQNRDENDVKIVSSKKDRQQKAKTAGEDEYVSTSDLQNTDVLKTVSEDRHQKAGTTEKDKYVSTSDRNPGEDASKIASSFKDGKQKAETQDVHVSTSDLIPEEEFMKTVFWSRDRQCTSNQDTLISSSDCNLEENHVNVVSSTIGSKDQQKSETNDDSIEKTPKPKTKAVPYIAKKVDSQLIDNKPNELKLDTYLTQENTCTNEPKTVVISSTADDSSQSMRRLDTLPTEVNSNRPTSVVLSSNITDKPNTADFSSANQHKSDISFTKDKTGEDTAATKDRIVKATSSDHVSDIINSDKPNTEDFSSANQHKSDISFTKDKTGEDTAATKDRLVKAKSGDHVSDAINSDEQPDETWAAVSTTCKETTDEMIKPVSLLEVWPPRTAAARTKHFSFPRSASCIPHGAYILHARNRTTKQTCATKPAPEVNTLEKTSSKENSPVQDTDSEKAEIKEVDNEEFMPKSTIPKIGIKATTSENLIGKQVEKTPQSMYRHEIEKIMSGQRPHMVETSAVLTADSDNTEYMYKPTNAKIAVEVTSSEKSKTNEVEKTESMQRPNMVETAVVQTADSENPQIKDVEDAGSLYKPGYPETAAEVTTSKNLQVNDDSELVESNTHKMFCFNDKTVPETVSLMVKKTGTEEKGPPGIKQSPSDSMFTASDAESNTTNDSLFTASAAESKTTNDSLFTASAAESKTMYSETSNMNVAASDQLIQTTSGEHVTSDKNSDTDSISAPYEQPNESNIGTSAKCQQQTENEVKRGTLSESEETSNESKTVIIFSKEDNLSVSRPLDTRTTTTTTGDNSNGPRTDGKVKPVSVLEIWPARSSAARTQPFNFPRSARAIYILNTWKRAVKKTTATSTVSLPDQTRQGEKTEFVNVHVQDYAQETSRTIEGESDEIKEVEKSTEDLSREIKAPPSLASRKAACEGESDEAKKVEKTKSEDLPKEIKAPTATISKKAAMEGVSDGTKTSEKTIKDLSREIKVPPIAASKKANLLEVWPSRSPSSARTQPFLPPKRGPCPSRKDHAVPLRACRDNLLYNRVLICDRNRHLHGTQSELATTGEKTRPSIANNDSLTAENDDKTQATIRLEKSSSESNDETTISACTDDRLHQSRCKAGEGISSAASSPEALVPTSEPNDTMIANAVHLNGEKTDCIFKEIKPGAVSSRDEAEERPRFDETEEFDLSTCEPNDTMIANAVHLSGEKTDCTFKEIKPVAVSSRDEAEERSRFDEMEEFDPTSEPNDTIIANAVQLSCEVTDCTFKETKTVAVSSRDEEGSRFNDTEEFDPTSKPNDNVKANAVQLSCEETDYTLEDSKAVAANSRDIAGERSRFDDSGDVNGTVGNAVQLSCEEPDSTFKETKAVAVGSRDEAEESSRYDETCDVANAVTFSCDKTDDCTFKEIKPVAASSRNKTERSSFDMAGELNGTVPIAVPLRCETLTDSTVKDTKAAITEDKTEEEKSTFDETSDANGNIANAVPLSCETTDSTFNKTVAASIEEKTKEEKSRFEETIDATGTVANAATPSCEKVATFKETTIASTEDKTKDEESRCNVPCVIKENVEQSQPVCAAKSKEVVSAGSAAEIAEDVSKHDETSAPAQNIGGDKAEEDVCKLPKCGATTKSKCTPAENILKIYDLVCASTKVKYIEEGRSKRHNIVAATNTKSKKIESANNKGSTVARTGTCTNNTEDSESRQSKQNEVGAPTKPSGTTNTSCEIVESSKDKGSRSVGLVSTYSKSSEARKPDASSGGRTPNAASRDNTASSRNTVLVQETWPAGNTAARTHPRVERANTQSHPQYQSSMQQRCSGVNERSRIRSQSQPGVSFRDRTGDSWDEYPNFHSSAATGNRTADLRHEALSAQQDFRPPSLMRRAMFPTLRRVRDDFSAQRGFTPGHHPPPLMRLYHPLQAAVHHHHQEACIHMNRAMFSTLRGVRGEQERLRQEEDDEAYHNLESPGYHGYHRDRRHNNRFHPYHQDQSRYRY